MIGNDIVDLKTARRESNWRRPRFLDKLFTESEQLMIQSSEHPEATLWLLWSMKESAYKCWMQEGGKRFFGPKRIRCHTTTDQSLSAISGSVEMKDKLYHTESRCTEQYIYTISSRSKIQEGQQINTQLFKTGSAPIKNISELTYHKLLAAYAKQERLPLEDLSVEKTDSSVPFLKHKTKRVNLNISLTHHGNYGAFAWISQTVNREP